MKKNRGSLESYRALRTKSFSCLAGLCCSAFLLMGSSVMAAPVHEKDAIYARQEQQKVLNGKVVDKNGESLIGVNIIVKGTTTGTTTDFNGNYKINVAENAVLLFTFIGYLDQEISVGNQSILDITLEEDVLGLDEVVVVGYGTQKKANLTGSVSAVKGDEMVNKPMTDSRQALQGAVPGLTIIDRGGIPGEENLDFKIRGISSISAGVSPLVLVDGIEMPLGDVNPNDIESVSILKDAASSSIYGAKAANGVVLITTKRGKEGGFKVDYNGYYGWQTPATLPELVGAEDYLNLVNEALVNAGMNPKYSPEYIQNTVAGNDPINYPYVNLFEELFETAPVLNQSVRISGGNDKSRIALSLNHLKQDGMLKNVESERFGFRLNTDFQVKENLKLRADVSFNRRENEKPNRLSSAIGAIVGTSPVTVLQYPNGVYGLNKDNTNALACLEVGGMNESVNEALNLKVGADLEILNGLTLRSDLSYKSINNRYKNYRAEYNFRNPENPDEIVHRWTPSKLTDGRWNQQEINFKGLLDYSRSFGDHSLHVLAGIDVTENKSYTLQGSRNNIYSDDYVELNTGDTEGQSNLGYPEDWALFSYLGRVNYSYKGKYLLEGNIRYDGSSRFDKGNKWGVFPSFSAGWRISEEDFMSSFEFLDNLKLRGSWGQLGNQNIGLYKFTSTVYADFPYNFNDAEVNGYSQWYYANKDITWETTEMIDFGFDLTLFNGKLDIVADWYQKDTKDVLLILPISYLTGLAASETNAGKMRNTGWEVSLTHRNKIKDFNYSIGFNIADVKNELVDFAGNEPSINGWTILKEGESVNAFYGYESDGLFQSQEEIDNHATQPNQSQLKPGDIKLVDQNGDGEINDEDRKVIGSSIPRFNVGLNVFMEYKGFDCSASFQGVLKAENYFYGAPNEGPAYEIFTTKRVLDRWTPDNPDASFPRLEAASNKNNYLYNDFWIRDASYIRLKNLQFAYSLPSSVLEKWKIEKLRFYVGATNLFTITDVESGLDPETYDGRPNYYPPVSTYTMGVQLQF
ncbi:SusC/RagA family TonB-linked outer membrane protein [Marinifilum caeruleilacunae]|uniref:TonB-dependent receptor n=1 Tax=Marinifilum caeruleilacunae TaxID=2499076 RepID=A0ABX1WUG3_9BACT|nr:TonB-dependent receptor [Marinifilum caeruleilacunae]NOU59676.1 TonB-dependent receptor [Marinifilum caeruleilacunae]